MASCLFGQAKVPDDGNIVNCDKATTVAVGDNVNNANNNHNIFANKHNSTINIGGGDMIGLNGQNVDIHLSDDVSIDK